jgi:uncharacterized membrane protein
MIGGCPHDLILIMSWNRQYRLRSYLRLSLWVIPIAAIVLEQVVYAGVRFLDARLNWTGLGLAMDGAKVVANTVITLSLSFLVFTFGSLLVAIQVASGQYTPRIIATTLLRDNVIRYTVGVFVFALFFAVKVLNRLDATLPQLLVFFTGLLGFACIVAFLFLIDYAARLLRPVSLVRRVGENGLEVMESVYPERFDPASNPVPSSAPPEPIERTVLHRDSSAIVLAVNVPALIDRATEAGGVIEFAPQVGDFVGKDEPLFHLRGKAASIDDHFLRGCVVFGSERTLEQDPLFAFRILVDIAIKALSAAINDPTTAVLAIDQLHRVLRSAGRRHLRTNDILDDAGNLRVIFRTPDWIDFVHLAFSEIRFYGASNLQIARRLRAMIINLANTLPAERHAALRQELDLLDRMLEKVYLLPEDLALARVPDSQGLGGSTDASPAKWAV